MEKRGPYQQIEAGPDDNKSTGQQPLSEEIRTKLTAQLQKIKEKSAQDKVERKAKREKAAESPQYTPALAPLSEAEEIARIKMGLPITPSPSPRDETIVWLLSQGLAPLPVAPAFPAEKYPLRRNGKIVLDKSGQPKPKFNGKNPSYLDKNGCPQIIKHSQYKYRLPTTEEMKKWFAHPLTGIGTLGTDRIQFLDLDRKNFKNQEEIDAAASEIFEKLGRQGALEQTRSGGWRIAITSTSKSHDIATDASRQHRGELLGSGMFAVLAPSRGYKNHTRTANIPEIKDLQEIGIFPVVNRATPVEQKKRQRKYQKPESGLDPYERFPADCWRHYGPALTLWVIARHFDREGKGWALLNMAAVEEIAGRKESTIRLWLKQGRDMGLFRFTATESTKSIRKARIKIYYASMIKIAATAGLEKLGAVRLIDFEKDIKSLRILATEAIAADLQKASRFAAEREEKQIAEESEREPIKTLKPQEILQPCAKRLSRVLWRSFWAIFVSEGFIAYGSCQDRISERRGLSSRQVRRHLTNTYRCEPSPVRGYKSGLGEINKAQIHQRLKSTVKAEFVYYVNSEKFFVDCEQRVWERKTNCYFFPENQLVNLRYLKKKFTSSAPHPQPDGMSDKN